jgi:uncharacterized membrane protein YgcG
MKTARLLAIAFTAATVMAGPAQAGQASGGPAVDTRWSQWLGCWRLQDDPLGTSLRVCIAPDASTRGPVAGVRWETRAGAQRGMVETIVADGEPRAVRDAECQGTERAEWSANGRRLYRTSEVTCGSESPQKISMAAFLMRGPALVVVQVADAGPTRSVRVQRYRRAADQLLADGTRAPQPEKPAGPIASDVWTTDEIIEASRRLPVEGVQAVLTETKGPFVVNKQGLIALSNAGVPESVIDLMIGLTYPKKFVVERAGGGGAENPLSAQWVSAGGWYDPIFFAPIVGASYFYDCYSPFGYGYRNYYNPCLSSYRYGPFGYSIYPYPTLYRDFYGPYGGWVVVSDTGPPTGPGPVTPVAEGRVVNGRGYTQVRPREPEPAVPTAQSRGSFGGSGSGGASGGSSGVSSGGYSSGGGGGGSSSGGDGGRVAVPRPPGGR